MRYLDAHKDAELPAGCLVVDAETEFLDHADAGDIVVQGERLCVWAERFWLGRGWPYKPLQSPIRRLATFSPELTDAAARQLLADVPMLGRVTVKASSLRELLEGVFPADLWRSTPSISHAAAWLLWLDGQTPPASITPLLKLQASLWEKQAEGDDALLYAATTSEEARKLLEQWLGVAAERGLTAVLPEFPLEIPERWQDRIQKTWEFRTVKQHGFYFREILAQSFPQELKEQAVRIGCRYFQEHPKDLQESVVRELAEFLPHEELSVLRDIVPPAMPTMPPTTVEDVLEWYAQTYLPYRNWAAARDNDANVKETCRQLGRAFALWFLNFYPKALANGDTRLCFRRSGQKMTHDRAGKVTLMIILDGIGVDDAEELRRMLRSKQKRLKLTRTELCFAALPTVTSICKPALRLGVAPCNVTPKNYALAKDSVRLLEHEDAAPILKQAKTGEFYIWSIVQTDKTYHQAGDIQTIRDSVQGVLTSISKRIAVAVQSVPNESKLDVIITTDHGRYIGYSQQTIQAPDGMESHQRAAWGSVKMANPNADFEVVSEGRAARLHTDRFGLSHPTLVSIGEDSFTYQDGSKGRHAFAHGGAWPEEVIIPWLEFQRDVEVPSIEAWITGSAVEGGDGEIEIHFVNGSQLELMITSLVLAGADRITELPINQKLAAYDTKMIVRSFGPWPSAARVASFSAKALLRQPAGEWLNVPVEVRFQSQSFQRRMDVLDDLP